MRTGSVAGYVNTQDEFILSLRESYPLDSHEAYEVLKFLVIFAVGCERYKIKTDFSKRLETFVLDLYEMGYNYERVATFVEWACQKVKID